MTRKALGRGLSALIGEEGVPEEGPTQIDIDRIRPSSHQPRRNFDGDRLAELAASLKNSGILQPIIVRRVDDQFEIIAGERRWRAAGLAGLGKVPAIVRKLPEDKILELSLIENIQREDLNPIEEARAYQSLIHDLGITQEAIAQRVGKDRSSVTNHLRLLKLPEGVQELVVSRKISMGHARSVLTVQNPSEQLRFAREIVARGMSVRQTERAAARWGRDRVAKGTSPATVNSIDDPNLRAAEERLRRRFSTIVRIIPGIRGGRIEIDYNGPADLSRIYDILMSKLT